MALVEGGAVSGKQRKSSLDGIAKGTPIALYHTGVGLIALGKATSGTRTADVDGDEDEEHYVQCAFDFVVDPEKAPERAVKAQAVRRQGDLPGKAMVGARRRCGAR